MSSGVEDRSGGPMARLYEWECTPEAWGSTCMDNGGGTVGTTLGGAGSGAGVEADGVGGRREVGRGGDEIAWMLRGYRGGTVCPFFTIRGRG